MCSAVCLCLHCSPRGQTLFCTEGWNRVWPCETSLCLPSERQQEGSETKVGITQTYYPSYNISPQTGLLLQLAKPDHYSEMWFVLHVSYFALHHPTCITSPYLHYITLLALHHPTCITSQYRYYIM